MVAITAAMVNELRSKTGQPMMTCKKMLAETGGDIEAAIRKFREMGVKTSVLERAATEGRVFVGVSADHRGGAIVELNCNTDFTAKSEELAVLGGKAVAKLLAGVASLPDDPDFKAELTALSQKTGENIQLGRHAAHHGEFVGHYLYSTAGKGKIAVLTVFRSGGSEELARMLGMHIVAAAPLALTRDEMPADIVQKEREIAIEQARQTGKPQQVAEKIAEGKLNAFFAEKVLLDQDFANPDAFKGKVTELLKSKGASLAAFVRIEIGRA